MVYGIEDAYDRAAPSRLKNALGIIRYTEQLKKFSESVKAHRKWERRPRIWLYKLLTFLANKLYVPEPEIAKAPEFPDYSRWR